MSVGVQPVRFWHLPKGREDLLLMLCPDWFAMPQKDWPRNCRVVGFPFSNCQNVDWEYRDFVNLHGAPIVFTPGTGVDNASEFFTTAEKVCQSLGRPGLFLGRMAPHWQPSTTHPILRLSYLDLEYVLKSALLLVHHGGIGSVAQAIRAGLPQVIVPGRFDQPDNALRVAILGLGAAIFERQPSPSSICSVIRGLLESQEIASQLEKAAQLVCQDDAPTTVRDLVTALMRRRVSDVLGAPRVSAVAEFAEQQF